MKRKLTVILAISLLLIACKHSDKSKQTDWQLYELNGQVERMSTTIYGSDTSRLEIVFSKQGMITERLYYVNNQLLRHTFYNDSMRWQINGEGEVEWFVNLSLNENRQVVEEWSQSSFGNIVTKYAYDEKGNLITETSYNDDGLPTSTIVYTYDKYGSVIKEVHSDADDAVQMILLYAYTRDNRLELLQRYNSENQLIQSESYTYNRKGKLSEERFIDSEGNVYYQSRLRYDGDNLIEKKCYGANLYDQLFSYAYNKGVLASMRIYESDNGELILLTNRLCDEKGNWIYEEEAEPLIKMPIDDVDMSKLAVRSCTYREIEYY